MSDSSAKKFNKASAERSPFNDARLPPQHLEAEVSVLGSILLDNDAINLAIEILKAEDFYRPAHQAIFAAMVSLVDKREPVDVITLSQELRTSGKLELAGGIEQLGELASAVPSAANLSYYAKLVKDAALKRAVIREASDIIQIAFKGELDTTEFLDTVEQKILSVSEQRAKAGFASVGEVVQDSIRKIEQLCDNKGAIIGTPSGFIDLDRMTAGFQPSDLIILAARPSMGKTAISLNMAQWVGIHEHKPCAIFSLEMSKEQLVMRLLCSEGRVDWSKVRTGNLGERDFPKLVDAASKIAEAPIFIDDTPGLTVTEMRAKARRLHRENPLSLIVVDYLQLMRSPVYSTSREQEISNISRSLKALAKELNVPIIALSQLNRSLESRDEKRPRMSDLRESGAIEQDADIIMFIYRDEVYFPDKEENKGIAEIIISKQRSGPTGSVRLAFSPQFTRFDTLDERVITEEESEGEFSFADALGAGENEMF